jgi:hypothetical protein
MSPLFYTASNQRASTVLDFDFCFAMSEFHAVVTCPSILDEVQREGFILRKISSERNVVHTVIGLMD